MARLTEAQRDIILHSLGMDRSTEAYRNYFCADDSHDDMPVLKQLMHAGFMALSHRINRGRDGIYIVTNAGRAALEDKRTGGEDG